MNAIYTVFRRGSTNFQGSVPASTSSPATPRSSATNIEQSQPSSSTRPLQPQTQQNRTHTQSSGSGKTEHPTHKKESTGHRLQAAISFSNYSTPPVRDSLWFCSDFMLGAGMVVIQPATGKVLLIYEQVRKFWFFPKGRKDVGESVEQAALREAYEESGYRVDFLPLYLPTNAPLAPEARSLPVRPCAEPFYVSARSWGPRRRRVGPGDDGGEYLTFWYVGQIPVDAVHEKDTGMPDEKNYQSYLLDYEDAFARLKQCGMGDYALILSMAYCLWLETKEVPELETAEAPEGGPSTETNNR